jgi:hypothetical protein
MLVPSTLHAVSAGEGHYRQYVRFLVGQPLRSECGPVERPSVQEIVEEDRVLLPNLILLVDSLLLNGLLLALFLGIKCICGVG